MATELCRPPGKTSLPKKLDAAPRTKSSSITKPNEPVNDGMPAGYVDPPVSACGYLHQNCLVPGPSMAPAVMINPDAAPIVLIAFAHGQLNALHRLLLSVVDTGPRGCPNDEVAMTLIEPAMRALEEAADAIHEAERVAA